MFLRDGGGVGLNVEVWRLLSKYAFLFSKKEGRGGPYLSPSPRCSVVVIRSSPVSKQSTLLGGEGGSRNRLL